MFVFSLVNISHSRSPFSLVEIFSRVDKTVRSIFHSGKYTPVVRIMVVKKARRIERLTVQTV